MSKFTLSGHARPSRVASLLAAAAALGLVAGLASLLASPRLAAGGFLVLWVLTALGIAAYHLWGAAGRDGVPAARFGLEASGPAPAGAG